MEWLAENWIWVLLGIVFVAMHLFGHGGRCGGHCSKGGADKSSTDKPKDHRH